MKETKQSAQPDLGNLSVRRRQELAQAQQNKKKKTLYWAIGIVIAVLVAALLIWDSGLIQRSAAAYKVGDYSFSVNEVNYYFNTQYNQIAPYASFYGLDTSTPLEEQEYEEGKSWKQFLMEQAQSQMQEVALLCTRAQSEGFTLSDDGKAQVASAMDSVKESAAQYNISEAAFLNYAYGRFMTPSAYEKIVARQQLASEYAKHLEETFDISAEDLSTYYQDNAASIDTFDFNAYYLPLGLTAEYDEEGNQTDYEPEALKAAQEAARAKAEELKSVLSDGAEADLAAKITEVGASDLSSVNSSSLSYYTFGEWVTDSARTPGEVGIVEDTSTDSQDNEYVSGYYVVRFNSRTLEEYYGVNFYNLLIQAQEIQTPTEAASDADAQAADAEVQDVEVQDVEVLDEEEAADGETSTETQYDWDAAKEKIEGLQQQWLDNGGTAEAFLTMAQENSEGSATEYTNVERDQQNAEVNDWLFGSEHKEGDYAILQDETLHGYRLVYFTGYDELYTWQVNAKNAIASDRYSAWLEEAKAGVTITETSLFSQAG